MSLKVRDSEWSYQSATTHLFEESAIEFKSTFCSKFYQKSSENQFQTNWCQLFMNINLFNNIADCLFDIIHIIHLSHHLVKVELMITCWKFFVYH